ncbi:MAG: hypothetical protein AAGA73_01350 [Pseudomonadota bacterium]
MSIFDAAPERTGDKFVRYDPKFLKMVFGTENMTPLWVADMDFAIADPIKEELQRLADRAHYAYEFDSEGVFSAISGWYQHRHDLDLDTERFVQLAGVLMRLLPDRHGGESIQT